MWYLKIKKSQHQDGPCLWWGPGEVVNRGRDQVASGSWKCSGFWSECWIHGYLACESSLQLYAYVYFLYDTVLQWKLFKKRLRIFLNDSMKKISITRLSTYKYAEVEWDHQLVPPHGTLLSENQKIMLVAHVMSPMLALKKQRRGSYFTL